MHTLIQTLLVCLKKEASILHLNFFVDGFVHFALPTCLERETDFIRIKRATSHS